MSDELPRIEMEVSSVVCNRHGEPFRENWPNGYLTFSVRLFKLVLDDETFQGEIGGNFDKITDAIKRTPLCERVLPSVLLHLYHEVEIGKRARCVHCQEIREGTPYNVTNRTTGKVERQDHLCFYCVVTAVEENMEHGNGHAPG